MVLRLFYIIRIMARSSAHGAYEKGSPEAIKSPCGVQRSVFKPSLLFGKTIFQFVSVREYPYRQILRIRSVSPCIIRSV